MPFLDLNGLQLLWGHITSCLSSKVDKVDGKILSTNDYTTVEKEKLNGIETGANKTIVDVALNSNSENTVQNKAISVALDGKVPTSRTINGKALIANITLSASDVNADASGSAAAALSNAQTYTDGKIADLINSAPTTLDTLGEIATAMEENADVVEALEQAIGTKANSSDLTAHTGNTSNPHNVTKAQIGLGNVENKSSATIRGELTKANVTTALGYTPPTSTVATQSVDGLMSANDKKTLDTLDVYVGDSSVSSQISNAISNKVDKVSGKGLSTNDYTTTEKNKLSGIEAGANKTTVVATVEANNTNPVSSGAVYAELKNIVDALASI